MLKVINILSTGDKIDNKGDEQQKPACYLNNSISLVINFLEPSKCRSDALAAAPAKKVLPAPSCYLKLDFPLVFSALGVKGCIFYLQLTIIYNPCLENTEGTDVLVERTDTAGQENGKCAFLWRILHYSSLHFKNPLTLLR